MFNSLTAIAVTLFVSLISMSNAGLGTPVTSSFSTSALNDEMIPDHTSNTWSCRLVFPESQIQNIVETINEYQFGRTDNDKSEILISICCVPPQFKPSIVVIPVYKGKPQDAYEVFGQLFQLNPISVRPTYIQDNLTMDIAKPFLNVGYQKSVNLTSLTTFHLKTLYLWFVEFISQVGSSGNNSIVVIRDRPNRLNVAEAVGTETQVQIIAHIKDDRELDEYAEEFTCGLADAIEQIESRIDLSKYGVFE